METTWRLDELNPLNPLRLLGVLQTPVRRASKAA